MKNNRAFARSMLMVAQIMAIMDANVSLFAQHMAIQGLGEYKSRGKGGKFGTHHSRPNFSSGHSTQNPHQGVQECERRVVGTLRQHGQHRVWYGFNSLGMRAAFPIRKLAAQFSQKRGQGYYAVLA